MILYYTQTNILIPSSQLSSTLVAFIEKLIYSFSSKKSIKSPYLSFNKINSFFPTLTSIFINIDRNNSLAKIKGLVFG